MIIPKKVKICEVSLRDGFQSLPFVIPTEDKLTLLEKITDAGIQEIEVGSIIPDTPMMLKEDTMGDTPILFQKMKRVPGVTYRALIQTPAGARAAAECGCEKVKINISASRRHYELMTKMALEDGLKGFSEIGKTAKAYGVAMLGSISLAFVSPYDGVIPTDTLATIIEAFLNAGATEISMNDTSGMACPTIVEEYFQAMQARFPEVKGWAFHPHNTRGTGLANVVAALQSGVARIDASLAGIGGCPVFKNASGNISTEDLVYLLDGMGIETGVSMEKTLLASDMVEELIQGEQWDSYIRRLEKIKRASGNQVE